MIPSWLKGLNIKRVRDARRSSLLVEPPMPTAKRSFPLSTTVLTPKMFPPPMELPLKALPPMKKMSLLPSMTPLLASLHQPTLSRPLLPEVFCVVNVLSVKAVDVKEKLVTLLKFPSSVLPTLLESKSTPSRPTHLLLTKFLSAPNTSSWLLSTNPLHLWMAMVSMTSTLFMLRVPLTAWSLFVPNKLWAVTSQRSNLVTRNTGKNRLPF
mmetsp:Transcript_15399/g.20309  ORF Transcript_15399/g.20309 Transcript_15399/m.20309 type:complete len:210 (-) Transcript_15399:1256-1885(-)